jgi:hypothetical protein
MEIFKALCASFFNIQSSIFNSEAPLRAGDGRGSLLYHFSFIIYQPTVTD